MSNDFERRYFKLPTGYLHVDRAGIAFTRSGNWAEAEKAQERRGGVGTGRMIRIVLGIALILVGMTFYAMKGLRASDSMAFVIAAGGAALGIYKLINKLQDDFAQTFRIPFAKVYGMWFKDEEAIITFSNAAFKDDVVRARLGAEDFAFMEAAFRSSGNR